MWKLPISCSPTVGSSATINITIHFFQLTNVQVLRGVRTTAGFVWKFRVSKAGYLYQISSCSYCNDTVYVLHYHYI